MENISQSMDRLAAMVMQLAVSVGEISEATKLQTVTLAKHSSMFTSLEATISEQTKEIDFLSDEVIVARGIQTPAPKTSTRESRRNSNLFSGKAISDELHSEDSQEVSQRSNEKFNAQVNVGAPPFEQPLNSTEPHQIYRHWIRWIDYNESNDIAKRVHALPSLFTTFAKNVKESLRTRYPDIEFKKGNFPIDGVGWMYQEEDFIWDCLYKMELPATKDEFSKMVVAFMKDHCPRKDKDIQLDTLDFVRQHQEMLRCFANLRRFYESLTKACDHHCLLVPLASDKVLVPLNYHHLATKQATLPDIMLLMLVPLMGEHFKALIGNRIWKGLDILGALDAITDQSEKLSIAIQAVKPAIISFTKQRAAREMANQKLVEYSKKRDGIFNNGSHFKPRTHHVNNVDMVRFRPPEHIDSSLSDLEAEAAMDETLEDLYGSLNGSNMISDHLSSLDLPSSDELNNLTHRPMPHPSQRTVTSNYSRPAHDTSRGGQLASTTNPSKGPCLVTIHSILANGSYDNDMHNARACPNAVKSGGTCQFDHSREGLVAHATKLLKSLNASSLHATARIEEIDGEIDN